MFSLLPLQDITCLNPFPKIPQNPLAYHQNITNFASNLATTKQEVMNEYEVKPSELIKNNAHTFYELYINGKCLFREFIEEIKPKSQDEKTFYGLVSIMEKINPQIMLPQTKFRHIKGSKRKDLFEFKKKQHESVCYKTTTQFLYHNWRL